MPDNLLKTKLLKANKITHRPGQNITNSSHLRLETEALSVISKVNNNLDTNKTTPGRESCLKSVKMPHES